MIFHSAVLAYVKVADRPRGEETVRSFPTIRVSDEAPGVVAATSIESNGAGRFALAHDARPLALEGPPGQSPEWLSG